MDVKPQDQPAVRDIAHIAEATLPAAGAFTSGASAFAEIPDGCDELGLVVKYTGAAANGNWAALIEWQVQGVGAAITVRQIFAEVNSGVFTSTYGAIPGPSYSDVSSYYDGIPINVFPGATGVRVRLAETGNIGTPGDAAAFLTVRRK